jgi:hypothetical protein
VLPISFVFIHPEASKSMESTPHQFSAHSLRSI